MASVNTLCVCILRLLCGEFHISQVTASAACSSSRDQGHPAGSGNNAEPNLAGVLPRGDTDKNNFRVVAGRRETPSEQVNEA